MILDSDMLGPVVLLLLATAIQAKLSLNKVIFYRERRQAKAPMRNVLKERTKDEEEPEINHTFLNFGQTVKFSDT